MIKKRIEKLEKEGQPVAAVPDFTPVKEISVEEWNAVYAPMVQEAYEKSMRPRPAPIARAKDTARFRVKVPEVKTASHRLDRIRSSKFWCLRASFRPFLTG